MRANNRLSSWSRVTRSTLVNRIGATRTIGSVSGVPIAAPVLKNYRFRWEAAYRIV